MNKETIVAQASPIGQGGVSVIRLSGKKSLDIAALLFKKQKNYFEARKAQFVSCYSHDNKLIDEGLSIFFKAPFSFTGEDIVEFQCHGSQIVCELVIESCISYGARLAQPGEFSERAFLNDKIDLVQAEAIADLIESKTRQAAFNATQSLKGKFSEAVYEIQNQIIDIRCFLEATIDFPDEEGVDFISESDVHEKLSKIINNVTHLLDQAKNGQVFQEGLKVVLAGEPNVGKSSLLNALSNQDRAIVTDIAGTTRDILSEQINIAGLPLTLIDTAGLRQSDDQVEQEGIKRAWREIESADLILYLVDISKMEVLTSFLEKQNAWTQLSQRVSIAKLKQSLILIGNKRDLIAETKAQTISIDGHEIGLLEVSAKQKLGIEDLRKKIFRMAGLKDTEESGFAARRRHLEALKQSLEHLIEAEKQLQTMLTIELVAEDLRLAHKSMGEIVGEFTADDLLGTIFSSFCIGK